MAWMKELHSRVGKVTFSERTTKTSSAKAHPRKVLAALRNSIALLENPDFRVTRKGKNIEPERCFVPRDDDTAEVWVPYARRPLDLGGGKTAIVVPSDQLKATLEVLVAAVEAGEFDAKIQQRQAAIRSRMKAKTEVKN